MPVSRPERRTPAAVVVQQARSAFDPTCPWERQA